MSWNGCKKNTQLLNSFSKSKKVHVLKYTRVIPKGVKAKGQKQKILKRISEKSSSCTLPYQHFLIAALALNATSNIYNLYNFTQTFALLRLRYLVQQLRCETRRWPTGGATATSSASWPPFRAQKQNFRSSHWRTSPALCSAGHSLGFYMIYRHWDYQMHKKKQQTITQHPHTYKNLPGSI